MRRFGSRLLVDQRQLLIAYRWLILGSVVLVAALSDPLDGSARWAILTPIAASLIMTVLLLVDQRWSLLAGIEVASATLLIGVSGGPESPFVAYFTVPLVHVALRGRAASLVMTIGLSLGALLLGTSAAGGIGRFELAVISEGMLLMALPALLWFVGNEAASAQLAHGADVPLTEKDLQLLEFLERGWTQRHIAEELNLGEDTVKVNVAKLYRRLGARSRAEALFLARTRASRG